MSGKESSTPRYYTSDSRQGYQPTHESDLKQSSEPNSYKSSVNCDSRYSDSGIWSGSNIHSEEIQSCEIPDPPKTTDIPSMPSSDNISSGYMRLDSGIDVSQHLSELSLRDDDSLNDLSTKSTSASCKNPSGSTWIRPQPLSHSSKSSSSPTDQHWIEDCFQQDEDGDTDLHLAIIHGFIETVYALVRLAPHPQYLNIRNNDRQTPLHLAVLTSQSRLVRLLVCAGAALDEVDRGGNTALHLAVQDCNLESVQAIISPVTVSETQHAQLRYSPRYTNRPITDIYNYEGQTCLHIAALDGNIDIIDFLLKAGADINAKEWKGGQTCLHLAVERRNAELCKFLLRQKRVNPEELSYAGHSAYQTAAYQGWDSASAEILRKYGVDTYESASETEADDDDDNEMCFSDYKCLQVQCGGLVDVGA